MLFPYQIGDTPLFRYLVGSDDPIQFSLDQNWDVPALSFAQSGGVLYQGPINRSLMQPTKGKIEGIVQVRSSAMAQELTTALQSLGGRIYVPFIVFRYEDSLHNDQPPNIDWLIADAVIESHSTPYPYAGSDLSNAGHVRLHLSISVTLMTPLRRLSPWFWEYRPYINRAQNPYFSDGAASPSTRFSHPKYFSEILDEHYFLRWLSQDTLLEPEFWELAYTEGILGGDGSEFKELYSVFYYSSPQRWTSQPMVVYAFTDLLPYGNLKITVQRSHGNFYGDDYEEESLLDLVLLDEHLNAKGYGGLYNSDIVYAGNIYPFPSYVYRNGAILEGLSPEWEYSG